MPDTEKITINLSAVDLGRIDLLASEGFYSNRTDFIRTAIRKELDVHRDVVSQSIERKASVIGIVAHNKRTLEQYTKKNKTLDLTVVGALQLGDDVTPELARAAFKHLKVYGVIRASDRVREALADRME